ncbi:TPA: hypothetical protein ACXO3J_004530 [Shigella flexneri Y]|uniref:hypothetical protein n=1 Tax=Shigella flexneri TaxID=623 RepID=UPI002090F59D|nr:hypothetical protein [Shigella flexneri]
MIHHSGVVNISSDNLQNILSKPREHTLNCLGWRFFVQRSVCVSWKSDFAWTGIMLLFRGEELAFSSAFSPVTIRKIMKCPPSGEEDRRKKDPPAKTLGMNSFRYSDCWRVKFLMN